MFLENEHLRANLKRLSRQLAESESKGETVHTIDVEEVQIKCNIHFRKLCDLQLRCVQAKSLSNRCTHLYDIQKLKLDRAIAESENLKTSTKRRVFMNEKVEERVRFYYESRFREAYKIHKMKTRMESFKFPTMDNFIQVVQTDKELDRRLGIQSRRMRIAKLSLQRHKKAWARLKQKGSQ
ncbi:hypothetical protein EG68_11046 [Paragonimus skrjabini miyazakii]|uniref:Uncharacterized protein n=1 Tax=Paragonimus skrjabini miyazakii TaxID=59628 RepID=A0A8S9YCC1_9TREM|nr:hypothetical protein EG68_11046 [Paragonimus skrjabini miyazakii]